MFALLSARFRRLLILMIAVPLGGRVLEGLGARLESRRGPSRLSRAMRSAGRTAGRYSRGPLRPRQARAAADAAGVDARSMNGHRRR